MVVERASIETESKQSIQTSRSRRASATSDRRLGSSRSQSRRTSRANDTFVVFDFVKALDCCVLCGSGLPFTQCRGCEFCGHNKCIQALFCKKVDLEYWRCPKCVTMSNMDDKIDEYVLAEGTMPDESQEETPEEPMNLFECPFCKIEMDSQNCECRQCIINAIKMSNKDRRLKVKTLEYNRCLQYRDFSGNIEYEYLKEESKTETMEEKKVKKGKELKEENEPKEQPKERAWFKACWSFTWFLLLFTFAFPIAILSALVFIITNCMDTFSYCCNPVSSFFLEGVKLPGTCCRGIISGKPMCTEKENQSIKS